MELDYTNEGLLLKFLDMGTQEIIDFLVENGLQLTKKLDFRGLPRGIYRRQEGTDLINFDGTDFNKVDLYGYGENKIEWALFDLDSEDGDWWILVLDGDHNPVNSYHTSFRVNEAGERTA